MRGEYIQQHLSLCLYLGSPPLARGILSCDVILQQISGITPACAGNTERRGKDSVPVLGSPPLARGIPGDPHTGDRRDGITPACAGNTDALNLKPFLRRDHPRLRGEYGRAEPEAFFTSGSPPLARGILEKNFPDKQ